MAWNMLPLRIRELSVLVLLLACFIKVSTSNDISEQSKPDAYVTLLYGDFVLGVRVLGLSIKRSGTDKEMVVVCAEDVSPETKEILKEDGWKIRDVHSRLEKGPNFLTKLFIWKLTDYRRIVYLDADTIVNHNCDELFRCGIFCAVYRPYDQFNAGVLVYKPSIEVYEQLFSEIKDLDPNDHIPDQRLLNKHYYYVSYARQLNASDPTYYEEPMRLRAGYNTDNVVYYWWSEWMIPEEEIKIIHYTMPPIKPWMWWAYPLFDLHWRWHDLRAALDGPDTSPQILSLSGVLPFVLLIGAVVMSFYLVPRYRHHIPFSHQRVSNAITWLGNMDGSLAKIFPTVSLFLSHYFSFCLVPDTMYPHQAIVLYCVWVLFFQLVFYSLFSVIASHAHGRSNGQVKPFVLRMEIILWCVVLVMSTLVAYYLPLGIARFNTRARVFFGFILFCLVCNHFIGKRLISLCSKK